MDWLLECNAGNNLRSTWSVGYLLSAEQGNGELLKKAFEQFLGGWWEVVHETMRKVMAW